MDPDRQSVKRKQTGGAIEPCNTAQLWLDRYCSPACYGNCRWSAFLKQGGKYLYCLVINGKADPSNTTCKAPIRVYERLV